MLGDRGASGPSCSACREPEAFSGEARGEDTGVIGRHQRRQTSKQPSEGLRRARGELDEERGEDSRHQLRQPLTCPRGMHTCHTCEMGRKMATNKAVSRARSAVGRRALAGVLAFVAIIGVAVGAATPANAGIGMWYVSSTTFQSFAALSSTGGDGLFQARAKLGGQDRWGVKSRTNTSAKADGFSFSHNAWLYQNGRTWASA